MDEKQERQLRRKAIRLTLKGLGPSDILKQIPRSRQWLYKWQKRFEQFGWPGLKSESRRPQHSPHQYIYRTRQMVARVRRTLQKRKVGLIGAAAVQTELRKSRLLQRIPSLSTIGRISKAAHLVKTAPTPSPAAYYPQPTPTEHYVLQAMDWTARYLEGGSKVFAFHTMDIQTHGLHQTISTNKNSATVRLHALETWKTLGLPDGLQMDNDAAFNGGYRTPRIFGQFVRLCLRLGIEPIFIPVREPKRNGLIERVNGLWSQAFWKRRHFRSVAQVRRAQPEFEDWYAHTYYPPTLGGQTPAQVHRRVKRQRLTAQQVRALPAELPITAGRIHFIRRVNAAGDIEVLNETWHVHKRLAHKYVWATIVTHEQRLRIYYRVSPQHAVRLVKTFEYPIAETVIPLRSEFKRPHRRRKMYTML
jgi:putative transposase